MEDYYNIFDQTQTSQNQCEFEQQNHLIQYNQFLEHLHMNMTGNQTDFKSNQPFRKSCIDIIQTRITLLEQCKLIQKDHGPIAFHNILLEVFSSMTKFTTQQNIQLKELPLILSQLLSQESVFINQHEQLNYLRPQMMILNPEKFLNVRKTIREEFCDIANQGIQNFNDSSLALAQLYKCFTRYLRYNLVNGKFYYNILKIDLQKFLENYEQIYKKKCVVQNINQNSKRVQNLLHQQLSSEFNTQTSKKLVSNQMTERSQNQQSSKERNQEDVNFRKDRKDSCQQNSDKFSFGRQHNSIFQEEQRPRNFLQQQQKHYNVDQFGAPKDKIESQSDKNSFQTAKFISEKRQTMQQSSQQRNNQIMRREVNQKRIPSHESQTIPRSPVIIKQMEKIQRRVRVNNKQIKSIERSYVFQIRSDYITIETSQQGRIRLNGSCRLQVKY